MNRFSSRKFTSMWVAFATFTLLLIAGKIESGAYVTLAIFILGGYFAANVMEKSRVAD